MAAGGGLAPGGPGVASFCLAKDLHSFRLECGVGGPGQFPHSDAQLQQVHRIAEHRKGGNPTSTHCLFACLLACLFVCLFVCLFCDTLSEMQLGQGRLEKGARPAHLPGDVLTGCAFRELTCFLARQVVKPLSYMFVAIICLASPNHERKRFEALLPAD